MRLNKGRLILAVACTVWVLAVAVGLGLLWDYENAPGESAAPPSVWPPESSIQPAADRATLVMMIHPHCPCSRATIGELARLMAQAQGRVTAFILLVKPEGFPDDWAKTDLSLSASAIPDVTVVVDDEGTEARRFRAKTSGQTVVYDIEGRLLFNGGITASRGHSGDNAGRSAVVSLLNTGESANGETFVFGCPLFGSESDCKGSMDGYEH